jgi:pantothenate kinase
VGPPGSGKSTIAQFLEEFLLRDKNVRVGRIQMDGYHIPKNKLSAQDMQRRGAYWTFDPEKLLNDLLNLKSKKTTFFPSFDHGQGDPVEQAVKIEGNVQVVIVEGNYLLLKQAEHWNRIAELFDQSWFIHADKEIIRERLVQRHMSTGDSKERAIFRVENNDLINADLIFSTSCHASRMISNN